MEIHGERENILIPLSVRIQLREIFLLRVKNIISREEMIGKILDLIDSSDVSLNPSQARVLLYFAFELFQD